MTEATQTPYILDPSIPAVERAIRICGGPVETSKKMLVSRQTVYNWLYKNRVPPEMVMDLVRATGNLVKPEELRPDVFR